MTSRRVLLVVYLAGLTWNTSELWRRRFHYLPPSWTGFEGDLLPGIETAVLLRASALLAAAIAFVCVLAQSSRVTPGLPVPAGHRAPGFASPALTLLLALLCASVLQPLFFAGEARWPARTFFFFGLSIGQVVWALSLWRSRSMDLSVGRGIAGLVRIAAVNVLLTLVVLEMLTTIWFLLFPSALHYGATKHDLLSIHRMEPGAVRFDARINSEGYADSEFFRSGPNDFVVAVLADSFGVGIVPPRLGFVNIAEERLRERLGDRYDRVAVHNYGVPSIGPAEYEWILEHEALASRPACVVLALFVGNDIHGVPPRSSSRRGRYRLQDWTFWLAAKRSITIAFAAPADLEGLRGIGRGSSQAGSRGSAEAINAGDYQEDLSPTLSEERFLEIETRRLEVLNASSPAIQAEYAQLFDSIRFVHQQVGEKLLVLVLPDEFQVNDELWAQLMRGRSRGDHERDLPQRRVREFCDSNGISCLDLLSALRKAEKSGRTYKPRDTHWNLRGNAVAGQVLADEITARFE